MNEYPPRHIPVYIHTFPQHTHTHTHFCCRVSIEKGSLQVEEGGSRYQQETGNELLTRANQQSLLK